MKKSWRWQALFAPMIGIVRAISRKPVTVMYPHETREETERFRGGGFALTVDPETGLENCIGCRLCEMICPSRILTVTLDRRSDRGYAGIFTLDFQACMQCELCVQVCPTDAIVMSREIAMPVGSRADLFLDKAKLLDNGTKLRAAWGAGTRLQAMHGKKERASETPTAPTAVSASATPPTTDGAA